jgi:hypothetical protein
MNCAGCKATFAPRARARYCSRSCRKKTENARSRSTKRGVLPAFFDKPRQARPSKVKDAYADVRHLGLPQWLKPVDLTPIEDPDQPASELARSRPARRERADA